MRYGTMFRMERRRRRAREKRKPLAALRNAFLLACAAAVIGAVGLVWSFAGTYRALAAGMPDLDDYRSAELAQTSVVYDARGNVVDELYGVQNRFVVGLEDIDPTLKEAVVSIEDHRFYEHRGLDFEAIGRAAVENAKSLSIQEGGSTISQQLIKNTYISQEQRYIPSFERKFAEASLAWQYEKDHSKGEILEQYLNTVYFGANAYGAEAAARTYFDKDAKDLTLPESAMLAGIINLPGVYDPFIDPQSAKERRDVVLGRMLAYGAITQKEYEKATKADIVLSRGRVEYQNDNEYFLNAVRKELAREYGDDTLYEGGLKIQTTLDPQLQKQANAAVDEVVSPEAGDPSAALVSVEPGTGAVRAMVGGSDFDQIQFNLATQAHRQAGSSFKPFVYAEAIKQGIDPDSMYVSKDLSIDMGRGERNYRVSNYDFIERGPINLKKAMAESDNTVFVQLAMDIGLKNVVEMAHDLGITSEVEAYPSTAIGGLGRGVTPFEMASAYSTFANAGTHMEPYLVQKVTKEKDGEEVVVEEHKLEGEQALTRDEAAVVTEALRGVVESGTASFYHDLDDEIGRPSAGKTGTTNNFVDAWFVGYVPQLSTSVWVGYPEERTPMVNINGIPKINGENYPLDIWSLYMRDAAERYPVQEFDVPSPEMDLEIKTDGDAYVKPETTQEEESEGPPESTTDEPSRFFQNLLEGNSPENAAPENAAPESTVPEGIVPENTVPENTVPENTVPEGIVTPERVAPERVAPGRSVAPETSVAPEGVAPETSVAPGSVSPAGAPSARGAPEGIAPAGGAPAAAAPTGVAPERATPSRDVPVGSVGPSAASSASAAPSRGERGPSPGRDRGGDRRSAPLDGLLE